MTRWFVAHKVRALICREKSLKIMLEDFLKPILENPVFLKYGLITLFLNTFFSSFIPIPVVITSTTLLLEGQNAIMVSIVMIIGTIGGGILTYMIGYDGKKFYKLLRKRHKDEHYEKSFAWLNRYGWSVIFVLSLLPALAEAVTIIAGIKKYDFKKFMIFMSIGRTIHVCVIVYFGNVLVQYFNYWKF